MNAHSIRTGPALAAKLPRDDSAQAEGAAMFRATVAEVLNGAKRARLVLALDQLECEACAREGQREADKALGNALLVREVES